MLTALTVLAVLAVQVPVSHGHVPPFQGDLTAARRWTW